jgi:hypothetical protein
MIITVIQIASPDGESLRVWSQEAATDAEGDAVMARVEAAIGGTYEDVARVTIATTRDISALV